MNCESMYKSPTVPCAFAFGLPLRYAPEAPEVRTLRKTCPSDLPRVLDAWHWSRPDRRTGVIDRRYRMWTRFSAILDTPFRQTILRKGAVGLLVRNKNSNKRLRLPSGAIIWPKKSHSNMFQRSPSSTLKWVIAV